MTLAQRSMKDNQRKKEQRGTHNKQKKPKIFIVIENFSILSIYINLGKKKLGRKKKREKQGELYKHDLARTK